jgi:hypothetical protein
MAPELHIARFLKFLISAFKSLKIKIKKQIRDVDNNEIY